MTSDSDDAAGHRTLNDRRRFASQSEEESDFSFDEESAANSGLYQPGAHLRQAIMR